MTPVCGMVGHVVREIYTVATLVVADVSFVRFGWIVVGALGALRNYVGLGLSVWSFLSLPTVSVGPYVLKEQPVVETGPYGWVRHPIYLGVLLIWLALAFAFRSVVTLLLTVAYVMPIYVVYIRSEEEMMAEAYGAAYADYCRRVGRLLPRVRRTTMPP